MQIQVVVVYYTFSISLTVLWNFFCLSHSFTLYLPSLCSCVLFDFWSKRLSCSRSSCLSLSHNCTGTILNSLSPSFLFFSLTHKHNSSHTPDLPLSISVSPFLLSVSFTHSHFIVTVEVDSKHGISCVSTNSHIFVSQNQFSIGYEFSTRLSLFPFSPTWFVVRLFCFPTRSAYTFRYRFGF